MPIEQAVFTSARTSQRDGYQLLGKSSGVTAEQARQLTAWGPSHGALLAEGRATSVGCMRLDSGQLCVSRTVAAGEEYSGRGGPRVYTQYLVVPEETAQRFANNPFAILRAAIAKGCMPIEEEVPGELPTLSLFGRCKATSVEALQSLASELGHDCFHSLLAWCFTQPVAIAGARPIEPLFATLVQALPVGCRGEFSFSTGLRYSPRRPCRWIAAPGSSSDRGQLTHEHNFAVLDLDKPLPSPPQCRWADGLLEALERGQLAEIELELEAFRQPIRIDALDAYTAEVQSRWRQVENRLAAVRNTVK